MSTKKADLVGPGVGDYAKLEEILPKGYSSLLTPRETQRAIFFSKAPRLRFRNYSRK
jgi:aspartate--ammonia ligase